MDSIRYSWFYLAQRSMSPSDLIRIYSFLDLSHFYVIFSFGFRKEHEFPSSGKRENEEGRFTEQLHGFTWLSLCRRIDNERLVIFTKENRTKQARGGDK